MSNLDLWNAVEKTDPNRTKNFSRGGGFSGTATNATYLAKKATEMFGPCGIGWGLDVVDERYVQGAPIIGQNGEVLGHDMIHVVRVKMWYERDGKRGEVIQYGQTQMVGRNKNGLYTDEEAPKKSLTDGMTKCLSLLGFAADIHLGLYDDNKYVNDLRREFAGEQPQRQQREESSEPAARPTRAVERMSPAQHNKAMKAATNEADLKKAFAKAWKEYENPSDPAAKTDAQLKFKELYDKLLADLTAPIASDDFNVE